MSRQISRFLAVILSVLVLAGCQAVPRSSEVMVGLSNLEQAEKSLQFNPASPLPDASPEEIARGFLAAAASAEDNFAVAREYLAPAYAAHWDPRATVLIDETSRSYTELSSSAADAAAGGTMARGKITVVPTATVNEQGFLRLENPRNDPKELLFEFVQVDDQWRISSAPSGIVLDRTTFTAIWEPHPLTFLTATGETVEEQRWFARDTTQLSTAIKQLFGGPQQPYRESLHSAFNERTELTSNVTVKGGEAIIEINDSAEPYSEGQLDLIRLQLAGTLSAFDAINTYKLVTPTGTLLTGGVSRPELASEHAAHFMLSGQEVLSYNNSGIKTVHPLSALLVQLDPLEISIQNSAAAAAVLNRDGVHLVNSGGTHLIDTRPQLRPPTIDRWGFVWSATAADQALLQVSNASNKTFEFAMPSFAPATVHGIRLSPDGSKLAVMLTTSVGTQVMVTEVRRDALGLPLGLGSSFQLVAHSAGAPIDLAWLDSSRIAILSSSAGGSSKVTVGGVGLFGVDRGIVPGGTAISGTWRTNSLRVLGGDGKVYRPQGNSRWEQIFSDVNLLIKNN